MLLCSFAFERSKVEGSSGAVSCWRLRLRLLRTRNERSSSSQSKTQGFRRSRRSLLLCSFAFERSKVEGSSGVVSCWRLRPSTASNSKREVRLLSVDLRLSKESKELASFAPLPRTFESRRIVGRTPHEDPPSHMFESFDEEGATCRPRGRDRDCVHRGHSCANAKQFARHPSCIVMEAC